MVAQSSSQEVGLLQLHKREAMQKIKEKDKFLFIETCIRNRKGNVLYHGTEIIPYGHEDYNRFIDKYGLAIKYYKP